MKSLFVAVWVVGIASGSWAVSMDDMVPEFMCPCPDQCGKALEVCECSDAAGYKNEVATLLQSGLTADGVREKFVEKYGPAVLASPPARGFGLVAYLLPPLAIGLGVLIAAALVRRWRRPAARVPGLTDRDIRRAEERMKKWNSSNGS